MNFSTLSFEQKSEYHKCIKNLKIGDKVEFYTTYNGDRCYSVQDTSDIAEVIVVGVDHKYAFLTTDKFSNGLLPIPLIMFGSSNISFYESCLWNGDVRVAIEQSGYQYTRTMSIFGILIKRVLKKQ